MSGPLDTSIIQERIRAAVPALARSVFGAAEFASVKDLRSFKTPAVYVITAKERNAGEPERSRGRPSGRQQAEAVFGVIVAVRNYQDRTGEKAQEEATPLIGSVRDALMGWSAGPEIMGTIKWLEGDVMDYDANTLLWADVFTTTHFIGGKAP